MMMKKLLSALLLLISMLFCTTGFAHPGRTDANGGHYNRKTGEYHYHNGGRSTPSPSQPKQQTAKQPTETIAMQPNTFYEATVTRVVDGDTVEVNLNGKKEKVRLIGVDTPETVHPKKPVQFYGKEASAFTKKELSGKKVWLQTDAAPRDKYRRLLAYVWTEQPRNADNEECAIRCLMPVCCWEAMDRL